MGRLGLARRSAVLGLTVAAGLLGCGAAGADVAPEPPRPPDEQDVRGVITFLIGGWSMDCSTPDRIVFDSAAVSASEQPGQPATTRPVVRSIRHGEFGMLHVEPDAAHPAAYVVVFRILSDDALQLIEQVENGVPMGMLKDELTLRRCD